MMHVAKKQKHFCIPFQLTALEVLQENLILTLHLTSCRFNHVFLCSVCTILYNNLTSSLLCAYLKLAFIPTQRHSPIEVIRILICAS